jgi:hypothetical protein
MAAVGHYEHLVHIGYRARAVGNDDADATPRTDAKNSLISACSPQHPGSNWAHRAQSGTARHTEPAPVRSAGAIIPAASSSQMRAWRWLHILVLRNIKSLSCETGFREQSQRFV